MNVSLIDFLLTGRLGDLRVGMTPEDITDLLGPPDRIDFARSCAQKLRTYTYGKLEIYFSRTEPTECQSFYFETGSDSVLRFPRCFEVADWEIVPRSSREAVHRYLRRLDLEYTDTESLNSGYHDMTISVSGVHMTFTPEGILWSFFMG